MPDYSVLQPIAETVDRRGQNHNIGVGNANTSAIGAAVEGFTTGMTNSLNWSGEILRQRTEYDPDKLLQEQIQRELKTREAELAVDAAERKQPFIERRELAGIEATEASTGLTTQQTRRASVTADVAERYGMEKERLELDKAREGIKTERLKQFQLIYGKSPDAVKASQNKQMGQVNKVYGNFSRQWNKDYTQWQKEKDDFKEFAIYEAKAAQDAGKTLTSEQSSALQWEAEWLERGDRLSKERQAYDGWYDDQNRVLKGITPPGSEGGEQGQTREQETQSGYEARANDYMRRANMADGELEGQSAELLAKRGSDAANERVATLSSIVRDAEDVNVALEDDRNVTAIQESKRLSTLTKAIDKLPEGAPKEAAKTVVSTLVDKAGGIESLLADSGNIKDDETRAEWDEAVISAAVLTGQTDQLSPMQRGLISAGLTAESAARPEQTKKQLSYSLADEHHMVSDPSVQKLRAHPLVGLASLVSDKGKNGFTLYQGPSEDAEGGSTYVYKITNTSTGQSRQLTKDQVEGDGSDPQALSQAEGLIYVLSELGAEATKEGAQTVTGNSVVNPQAVGATYKSGVSSTTPRGRLTNAAASEAEQISASAPAADTNGYITTPTGARQYQRVENYPTLTAPQVGTPGMKDDLSGRIGFSTLPKEINGAMDNYFSGLKDGAFNQRGEFTAAFVGQTQEKKNYNQLIEDVVDYTWDKVLTPEDKAFYDNTYRKQSSLGRLVQPGQQFNSAKELFNNSFRPDVEQELSYYTSQVLGKMQVYSTGIAQQEESGTQNQIDTLQRQLGQPGLSSVDRAKIRAQIEQLRAS